VRVFRINCIPDNLTTVHFMTKRLKRLSYAPNLADPGTLFVQACMPRQFFSAGSLGILNGDEIYMRHFGVHSRLPGDPKIETGDLSMYDVASVTKSVVALIVLWAVTQGFLKLDDPVRRYVPLIKVSHGREPVVRDLLTYAARFQLDNWEKPYTGMSLQDMVSGLMSADILVGNMTHYSNYPPIVLAVILESVTGKKLPDLCREVLFKPLGIFPTFDPPQSLGHVVATEAIGGVSYPGIVHDELTRAIGMVGAAGLFATCEDLLHIARFILDRGAVDGNQIIDPELIEQMGTNHFDQGPRFGLGWGIWDEFASGYDPMTETVSAMGLQGYNAGAIFKNGFSGCHIAIFPKIDTAVAVMTNRVHPDRSTSGLWINRFRYSVVMAALTGFLPLGTDILWANTP
jgi:serine-type D-Ala-D-Ala carboxypeptidase